MKITAPLLARYLHSRLLPPPRPHDQVVGDAGAPYMLRWRLGRNNPAVNFFLHQVLRPDEEGVLHDHPWPSASLILSGALVEYCGGPGGDRSRYLRAGDVVLRRPSFAHRLSPDSGVAGDTWTLFVTGPKMREWGFHCADGWRHWKEYTAPGADGQRRGCG